MSVKVTNDISVPKASVRLAIVATIGILVGVVVGFLLSWSLAPLVAWDVAALSFMATTWFKILPFDAGLVKKYALREDPSRVLADIVLIIAAVASLGAVGLLLVAAKDADGGAQFGLTFLAVASVVISWALVHTVFALKYAEIYYSKPEGGVDFGESSDPVYVDFAYLAATLGMTYQVSDTTLKSRQFRETALKHALLSYLLGTVIIATTINLVAGLGQ
jgi:uncharacterized membrane protein